MPDALHVGFSKCASTFLQEYLDSHPNVFLVNQSHYFAPFEFGCFRADAQSYCRLFETATSGQLRIESDEHILLPLFHPVLRAAATTLEAVTEVSGRIRQVNPNAKIIIVVRNQVSLMVSRYSEYVLGGGKQPFDTFVNEFLECSVDGTNYYQNYYFKIARIFFSDFGKDNVLIFTQEGLAANEAETLARLCRFLEIRVVRAAFSDSASRRVGLSGLGIRSVRWLNRLVVVQQEMSLRRAEVRIPYLAYKVVQRGLREIDYRLPKRIKGDKNEVLSDAVQETIKEMFRDDNAALGRLLGTDLVRLGY